MLITTLFIFLAFSILLSGVLLGLSYLFVEKSPYSGKISAYECGFAPMNHPTNPFSIKFFVVGVIFLIFDLEIIYLIPWSYNSGGLSSGSQLMVCFFFLFIVAGLIYEWMMGGLEWL